MKQKFAQFLKSQFGRWLKAAGVRALKTVAQSVAAGISTCVILSEVNWTVMISTALLAGLYSLLTSVAGLPEVKAGDGADGNATGGGESNSAGGEEYQKSGGRGIVPHLPLFP